MKKILAFLTVISVLIGLMALSAFAAAPTKDGVYEVPIQLKHAEKDTESMGNSYIVHTALLEIENGAKYITIVSDSTVMNLEFSYYTDGSVSGNTQAAEKVESVEIGGKTYSVGYRFPVKGTGQLLGVKFKASIMPISPSARVYIDYDNSVLISAAEETSTSAPTKTPSSASTETKPNTAQSSGQNSSAASEKNESVTEKNNDIIETETLSTSEESVLNENTSQVIPEESEPEETTLSTQTQKENNSNSGLIAGVIIAVVIIAGAAAAIVIKTRIKK